MEALQGFDLFDQPAEIQFAKTRSDATVQKDDGDEELEKWKQVRLAEKGELHTALLRRAQITDSARMKSAKRPSKQPPPPQNPPNVPPTLPISQSALRSPVPSLASQTSTYRRTRPSSSETSRKSTARTSSPHFARDSLASRKCVWCLAERDWHLPNTRTSLVGKRLRKGCMGKSSERRLSRSRTRGSNAASWSGERRCRAVSTILINCKVYTILTTRKVFNLHAVPSLRLARESVAIVSPPVQSDGCLALKLVYAGAEAS